MMSPSSAPKDPLTQYFDLTDAFFDPAFYPEARGRKIDFLRSPAFRQLDYAFQTLPRCSTSRTKDDQEWNPFSQRIPLYDLEHLRRAASDPFFRAHEGSVAIAIAVHELFHILLWEPFFTGRETVRSARSFADLSLVFEAFCYWYGEIVFTNRIQLLYPDGMSVFHRGYSPSAPYCHPARSFELEGITEPSEILEIYVDAFRGYDSRLNAFATDAGSAQRRLIYGFYAQNRASVLRHHRRLSAIGVFDRFRTEFCVGAEAISMLDESAPSLAEILRDPKSVGRTLDALGAAAERASDARMDRIRMRREIQLRAYFLLADLEIVNAGRLVRGRTLTPLRGGEVNALASDLEAALVELAAIWRRFVAADGVDATKDEVAELDARVDRVYVAPGPLAVAYKHQIHPSTGAGDIFGIMPRGEYSRRQLREALGVLRRKYLAGGAPTSEALRGLERLAALSRGPMDEAAKRSFVRTYNGFFRQFMPLSPFGQRFVEGRFRENDFIYL